MKAEVTQSMLANAMKAEVTQSMLANAMKAEVTQSMLANAMKAEVTQNMLPDGMKSEGQQQKQASISRHVSSRSLAQKLPVEMATDESALMNRQMLNFYCSRMKPENRSWPGARLIGIGLILLDALKRPDNHSNCMAPGPCASVSCMA